MNLNAKYQYRCLNCHSVCETDRLSGMCCSCMQDKQPGQLVIEYNIPKILREHNRQNIIDGFEQGFFADLMPFCGREDLSVWYNFMSPLRKIVFKTENIHQIYIKDESIFPGGFQNRIHYFFEAFYGKQISTIYQNIFNPIAIEALKILAYELYIQLEYEIPDAIFINESDILLAFALVKGFTELFDLKMIRFDPAIYIVLSKDLLFQHKHIESLKRYTDISFIEPLTKSDLDLKFFSENKFDEKTIIPLSLLNRLNKHNNKIIESAVFFN